MTHSKFLDLAAKEAEQGIRKNEGGPFGAVIVRSGKIIAKAHNTVLKGCDATNHAEINAIHMASKKLKSPFLKNCTVYSTTEPCPMCFSAIHWAQVPHIVYSTTIADVKKLGFNELSISNRLLKKKGRSPVSIKQIKNKSCSDLLSLWKDLPAQKTY